MQQTKGTYYNTDCPHCGKANHYISTGHVVVPGKYISFTKKCHYCKKVVWYHARLEIMITAYSNDPFEELRKS